MRKSYVVGFIGVVIVAIAIACGGGSGGGSRSFVDVGCGPADVWQTLPVEFVDECADAGFRFLVTEDRPTVQVKDWRRGEIPDRFPELAREWNQRACRNDQTHIVFVVNWNVLPIRDLPDSWFVDTMHGVLATYDPECTWIEALVEPDEGDREKRRRWIQIAADLWPGTFIMASAAEHLSSARRDFVDRHPGTIGDARRWLESRDPRLLVITDGGVFSFPPNTIPDLPGLVALSIETRVPFILYTDRYAPGDVEAHRVLLREMKKGVTS